jgi:hypothetical protein
LTYVRLPKVEIPILTFQDDSWHKAVVMAYHYSRFVIDQGAMTPLKEDLAGSMLGLLLSTVDSGKYLSNNKLSTCCEQAGFNPVIRVLSEEEDIRRLAADPRTQSFLEKFGAGKSRFVQDHCQQLVMLGPILLMIGSNIKVETYPGWLTRCIRDFMNSLGLVSGDNIWVDKVYPSFSCMIRVGTFLPACFTLRRELFRICWEAAGGQSRMSNLFKEVVRRLEGVGMKHIVLIDEYLCKRYKELLSIRPLAHESWGMHEAWRFLDSIPKHERYYVKILYDKVKTAPLNLNKFPLHVAAAVSAARFDNQSFGLWEVPELQTPSAFMVSNMVQMYLTQKLRPVPVVRYHSNSQTDIVPSANSSQEQGQAVFLPPACTE